MRYVFAFLLSFFLITFVFYIPFFTGENRIYNPVFKRVAIRDFSLKTYSLINEKPDYNQREKLDDVNNQDDNTDSKKTKNDTGESILQKKTEKSAGKQKPDNVSVIDYHPDFTVDVMPVYPVMARRRGLEGKVQLMVIINSRGDILNVIVAKTSGYDLLDSSAVNAVNKWNFSRIATGNDRQVIRTEINFLLERSMIKGE